MQIYKTVDSNNLIRLEEDSGAAVTMYQSGSVGIIIAIQVPRSDREEGIGTALLKAAEIEAAKHGIKSLESDFSSKVRGMTELFESRGYEVTKTYPILSMDMAKLISNERVKKILNKNVPGIKFASLEELLMMQWDQLVEILDKFSIRLSSSDLGRFSQSASGVVYDAGGEPKAFVLSSEKEDSFHVDFLAAPGGDGSFVMAALQGMLLEVIAKGGAQKYPTLTAISANDTIKKLLENLLGAGNLNQVARVMYASRDLTPIDDDDIDIEEDITEGAEDEVRREVRTVLFQDNIAWKPAWQRGRHKKDNKDVGEADATDKSESGQEAKKAAAPAEGKDASTVSDFPDEFMSPYDMDFDYDKDEDETDGLIEEGLVRICEDNLESFESILPIDALYNLPRPYFRGLATGSDEDSSYIVYEYKDLDNEIDNKSQIIWMNIRDEDAGASLISEYTHEIGDHDITETYLETAPDDIKKKVLSDADFKISERESDYVSATLDEFLDTPFARGRAPEYVIGLGEVGERQFKRGVGNCLLNNKKGVVEDLAYLPMEWFDGDVSTCVITDDKVSGMLLLHQLPSRRLFVDLLFSASGDSQMDIINMIRRSIQAAAKKYPHDTPVVLYRHNKMVKGLVSRMFPGKTADTVLSGKRKEI